jgi:hypothetical protein
MSVTSTDFLTLNQTASSSPLVGSALGACVLTIPRLQSGANLIYTINPGVAMSYDASGGYNQIGSATLTIEAQGTGGTEPTVSWVASA